MDRLRRVARLFVASPWPVTLLVFVPAAIVIAARQGTLWAARVLDTQPWFHPIPPRGAWIPFIHPPGYAEFMFQVSALSDRLWVTEGLLIYLSSGVVTALLTVLFAVELGRRVGAPWAWFGSCLLLLSPATLRPFEHYPFTKLLVTAGLLWAIRWVRDGRTALMAASFATCIGALMLHLSAWFVIGPVLAATTVLSSDRRNPAVFTGSLVGLFLLLGFAGTTSLWDILASTGPAQNRSTSGVVAWANVTYEWNDPWLWAPLALWVIPGVRFARREGLAIAFGMGAFGAITGAMMWQTLVIGGALVGSHHYFELIDGLACFAAALALAAAHRASESRWLRGAVLVSAAALLVQHTRLWLAGLAKLEELAGFPG